LKIVFDVERFYEFYKIFKENIRYLRHHRLRRGYMVESMYDLEIMGGLLDG